MITFKNFETGDRIVYKYKWLALFLLGPLYLFLISDYRNMFRYCVPWLWLEAMIALAYFLLQAFGIAGILLGFTFICVALVVWVMACSIYQGQRLKDLFINGYIPINNDQWELLKNSPALSDVQFESFRKLYKD